MRKVQLVADKKEPPTLDNVLDGILKQFGPGSIMRLGDNSLAPVATIGSGSIALDEAMIIGGFPRGRIVEIYGPESSGKTSLALHATGNAQKAGGLAAFIDAEHALDPEWAATLGVDTDSLYVSQPDSGEQALEIASKLTDSGKFAIVVIDSVAALVPEAEIKGEMGDHHVALQARLMSQALRKLTTPASVTGTCIIFINQLREKVGVFFGNAEVPPGGKALKFYASIRLDVRRIATIKDGDMPVGSKVRVKVVKNKLAPPFRTAEFDFMFGEGISHAGELLDLGVARGVVKKSGAYYTYDGAVIGNGREAAKRELNQPASPAEAIEKAVREMRSGGLPVVTPDEAVSMEGPAPWGK